MRVIINGKLYDTETAELIYREIVTWRYSRWYYMTAKRAFFCYYDKTKEIKVKTEEEIRELLGEHDVDKYIELFGEPDNA